LLFLIFALLFVASFVFSLSKLGINIYRLVVDEEIYVFMKISILGKKVTVSDIYNIYIRVKKTGNNNILNIYIYILCFLTKSVKNYSIKSKIMIY